MTAIPTTMVAVQVDTPGGLPAARQVSVPQPGPGEVLVRMAASPINPSDVGFLSTGEDAPESFPRRPGFEGSGTVVAAGQGVLPRLLLGKRVAVAAPRGGAWAEYLVTGAGHCFPLGRPVSLEQGAMLLVNPLTAWALFEIARQEQHQAIISTAAASALGKMILRLGRQRHLEVINIVRRPEQAAQLRALGATHVLVSTAAGFPQQLGALARQLHATLVLDAVGGDLASLLVETAPPGSTILLYGDLAEEKFRVHPRQLITQGKRLTGFWLRPWLEGRGLLRSLRDLRAVRRLVGDVLGTTVQRRLPLSEVGNAVTMATHDASAGKILLVADPVAVPLAAP